MGKRLYCGNLPFSATADEVREIFAEDGRTVTDVHIVTDRETGRSRGFAFVELASDEEAERALRAVDGRMFGGRPLAVKEARERAPRPGGFGGPPGAGPRGPRPPGRPGFGGPRMPEVERRPPLGGRGGFRGDRGPGPNYGYPPEPMPMPEPDWGPPVTQDFSQPPEGGYPPPADGDYRDRGDRGRRGRDRRGGGRRRGFDDLDDDW